MRVVWESGSAEDTVSFAERMGALLLPGDMIAYSGGLGAGKTTFTRGLAAGMGLSEPVSSPTFTIVNAYEGSGTGVPLYHFDFYRIHSLEELETTGFYDYPQEESVFAMEWSENISAVLPPNVISVTLEVLDAHKRRITIEGDERFAVLGT